MALTITLSGNSSILTADYFPSIELNKNFDYACGLVDFQTYNSIPNIDEINNVFCIGTEIIEFPIGAYEINHINRYICKTLQERQKDYAFTLSVNNNTLQCEISANVSIYFDENNTIGGLLGFSKRILKPNITHKSDERVNINRVNAIRIECNIIAGSYVNNKPVHTIHEFAPTVPPGYKIIEVPRNVIYLPVNVKQITSVTLRLVDQDGDLINFRDELITARLHIKPNNVGF